MSPAPPSQELRFQAVLELLQGNSASVVSAQYGIARSSLYKFRKRALAAIHKAMKDEPRGPKHPHNRVGGYSAENGQWHCRESGRCSAVKTAAIPVKTARV